ncbi:type I restriction endonuclease subunit R [Bacteroides thetaiotaomicron]|uniref:type I restriction endonuclease subunit R n=1 Tax=Bacteroides thetaiotaomicron TaxID=818 RepID=UPI004063A2F1
MTSVFSEDSYEQALIALYKELGYEYLYGPEIERDLKEPLLLDKALDSIQRINPSLPLSAIEEAIKKLQNIEGATLIETNFRFTLLMQNGIEITYVNQKKEHKTDIVRLIDYDHPEQNTFSVVNQYTMQEYDVRRADIILFVNGLPLVVVELKSPSREETDASDAYLQLRNYMQVLPKLFQYNAFSVMSDMADTKVGTITSNEDRFMEWKQPGGELADYDTAFREIFTPTVLVNVLKNYILFNEQDGIGKVKILAGYHQYYAVEKASQKAVDAVKGDGKIGVFWHTQGSGKSLSMVFLAHHPKLQAMNPTIVVITDRNDLDDQLFGQFSSNKSFLRQTAKQASSRDDLRELLEGRHSGGIIFTTMQKFDSYDDALSNRRNIIVMTDEAHRGQYGMEEKIDEEGRTHIGTARKIRNSLPNASFIGFTGTPISDKDRDTQEIFGDYIDVYDMTQAVDDGATMPVYYESRVIKLQLNDEVLEKIDAEYEALRDEGANEEDLEKNKKEMAHMDALLGNDETIDALVNDIISHYESNRQYVCGGKAMLVAYSRPIAMKIYHKMLELRPEWTEKVKVVMTSGNQDPEEWQKVIGTKAYKNELARRFKDNKSEMKIAIVVDMWLTGFDVPSLSTMYVYKPMKGHNLMQAIARVNRVFPEKAGGLIVDYVGIASALKAAMNTYTKRDRSNFGNNDIRRTALIKFQEHMEICRDQLHGFDYKGFFNGTEKDRAMLIKGGVNFLMAVDKEENKKEFVKNASLVGQSVTLCRSLLTEEQRIEAAFIETVRTLISRLSLKGKITKKQINERIAALLEQSIQSDGVVNLFNEKTEFSLFDEKFMEEIKQMKEKNIAVELLKKLLQGRVRGFQRTNVVKSEQFSDLLSDTLSRYLKGLITNEEVIQELLKLAKAITDSEDEGEKMGLSKEEKAFYDALTRPQAVKDFYQNEELIALTRELTETLRKNRTIDWNRRDSARANMRRIVKRMLKKYKYPPEDAENAMETVLQQCEQWAENNDISSEDNRVYAFYD